MGSKKAAPDRVKAISHLEVALGFITGDRSLSRVSEDRRAPEVTKFLERIVVLCIEFFNNATPAGLREDKHLKVYVQEVLHEFGPILWPDCVPSWAFDPLDLKQSVLNKLAEEYPRQLRYSHLPDRAILLVRSQAYVERKIIAYRDLVRKKTSNASGELGLDCLAGWKESGAPEDADTSPREDAEDEDDDRSYSDPSCLISSSVGNPRDTRKSQKPQKTTHHGVPTAPASRSDSETASDVRLRYWQSGQSDRIETCSSSKRARSPDYEADQSSKRAKCSPKLIFPTPNLRVKCKLTKEKTFRDTQHPECRSDDATPAPASTPLPQGSSDDTLHRTQHLMQSHHTPRSARRCTVRGGLGESEDATMLPSNHGNGPQSSRATSVPVPSTLRQQESASNAAETLQTAELAQIGQDSQVTVVHNSSPESPQTSEAGQTAVQGAAPASVEHCTGNVPTVSVHPTQDQRRSGKLSQSTNVMIICIKRNNEEAETIGAFDLEGVTTTRGLFIAVQEWIEELMEAGETIVKVSVK